MVRYAGSDYGNKLAGEELFFDCAKQTGAVYATVSRICSAKWLPPQQQRAVATFCNNVANDLPITVNDRATELGFVH